MQVISVVAELGCVTWLEYTVTQCEHKAGSGVFLTYFKGRTPLVADDNT